MRHAWTLQAKCAHDPRVDPDFFFPVKDPTTGYQYPPAQAIAQYCSDCPVRRECESFSAKARHVDGYFGGKEAAQCKTL